VSSTTQRKTVGGNAFTKAWKSAKGKDVTKGDHVKTVDGKTEGIVTARHTRPKDRIPMLLVATGAARKGKGKQGKQTSIPAAEVEIVKKGE
jgi:hypothetical protein